MGWRSKKEKNPERFYRKVNSTKICSLCPHLSLLFHSSVLPVGGVAALPVRATLLSAPLSVSLRLLPFSHGRGSGSWTSRSFSLRWTVSELVVDSEPWLPRRTFTVKSSRGGSDRTDRAPSNAPPAWTCCCPWASPDRGRKYPKHRVSLCWFTSMLEVVDRDRGVVFF